MSVYVKAKNIRTYIDWFKGLSYADAKELAKSIKDTTVDRNISKLVSDTFEVTSWCSYPESEMPENKWQIQRDKTAERYIQFFSFAENFGQKINVKDWVDGLYATLYIGNPDKCIIIVSPEKYMEKIGKPDYSDMTPVQVKQLLGTNADKSVDVSLIPADAQASLTPAKAKDALAAQKDALGCIEEELDKVKNAEVGELAEMKAAIEKLRSEMDEKKNAMMAELNAKKAEMEAVKEKLELQIYLIDSQIYAIECYAGETVNFTQLRTGKNAPVDTPVVIHQKLRFLDEDLGRLASLYSIDWSKMGLFEMFLKESPVALDTFAPNERCVVLVRVSRTGKVLGTADTEYANMLDNYEYYHGKTVGIIIRSGENLYLGWTDEDRIHIDDDLIVSQVITTQKAPKDIPEWQREDYIKAQKQERKKLMDGIISRTFIYNILQGIVDHSNILPLPDGGRLSEESKYVVYSVADKWLVDNRFGNFTDIVARCNEKVTKGDTLLTVQHLKPEKNHDGRVSWGRQWENVRGRGDKNRTHDTSVEDCTLHHANLVEFDEPIQMVHYTDDKGIDHGWTTEKRKFIRRDTDFVTMEGLDPSCRVLDEFEKRDRHVFVSVASDASKWNATDSRVNFELYDDEFINLTYMNSVWLESVITSKNLGGWNIGGKTVDYSYAIRYLKTAMDFVRSREQEEHKLIAAEYAELDKIYDWQVKLSEWKIAHGVRTITEFQAKRFAQTLGET